MPYKKGESYLAEQFRQITHYLAEQFRQIVHYLAEHLIQTNDFFFNEKFLTLWIIHSFEEKLAYAYASMQLYRYAGVQVCQ